MSGCGAKILGAVALTVLVSCGARAATSPAMAMPPAAPAETAEGPAPIASLLAKADPEAGKKFANVCMACHTFGKGEPSKIGPNLWGIVGSPHARMAGFAYSDAMKKMKAMEHHVWDYDELNAFLYDPRAHLPGTKMTFAGIKNDSDRANVIAYLRSLADKPLPLPKE